MTKRHFIALADAIRKHNANEAGRLADDFTDVQLQVLADFCASQNKNFMPNRWIGYIRGECGPNGGAK
jgi:hypothetical protein